MLLAVRFRRLLGILFLLCSAPLYAGAPVLVNVLSLDDAYNLASPGVGTPITKTITLTFGANGAGPGIVALLNSLAVKGVNAADFAIVPGGTCSAGTMLGPSNPSCTVIVQYLPPSTANETAQLAVNCSTIGIIGGFTLTCGSSVTGTTGSMTLYGSALAALVQSAPALDPKLLTLLATTRVGAGIYFAARRNG